MKEILAVMALIISGTSVFAKVNTDFQTNASIEETCYLKAVDVNFGELRNLIQTRKLPGKIYVRCTKNINYQIDLDSLNYQMKNVENVESSNSGNNAQTGNGQSNNTQNNGQTSNGEKDKNNGNNGQTGNGQSNNTQNRRVAEASNISATSEVVLESREMLGEKSGDSLKYSISLPNDESKEWRVGEYSYTSTATGLDEIIPFKVTISEETKILPEDNYVDIVLVNLTY